MNRRVVEPCLFGYLLVLHSLLAKEEQPKFLYPKGRGRSIMANVNSIDNN